MLRTRFTDLVGCTVPLQLAAMPGVGTPELVAAVAGAGGLGMIGLPQIPAPAIVSILDGLAATTRGTFGMNFLIPFLDRAALEVAAPRARVVEFFYGPPDRDLVRAARSGGALVSWQVGSRDEALEAVDAGCDLVVAQGNEAGGHVRGELGLLRVLSEVLDAVGEVPVVAAGGIGSAREVAGALAAGASAVRVGTRFVAAVESGAHPEYVRSLVEARAEDTVLTDVFSVGWDAPHRVLRSAIEAARAFPGEVVGEAEWGGEKRPVARFSAELPTRETTGEVRAMALYAGQSVGAVRQVRPAREIVAELVGGAEELLLEAAPAIGAS
ncbi:MAG TPA: nitronate monooxygenase [Thermoanaerobaculia bacterium]|nr:nitronate monooxygenase [Thermoanaerobaculia bacterium]